MSTGIDAKQTAGQLIFAASLLQAALEENDTLAKEIESLRSENISLYGKIGLLKKQLEEGGKNQ